MLQLKLRCRRVPDEFAIRANRAPAPTLCATVVAETMQPGMSISYVACRHGLSPGLVAGAQDRLFALTLRAYLPRPELLSGAYRLPSIARASSRGPRWTGLAKQWDCSRTQWLHRRPRVTPSAIVFKVTIDPVETLAEDIG